MLSASSFTFFDYQVDAARSTVTFTYRVEFAFGITKNFTDRLYLKEVSPEMWAQVPGEVLRPTLQALLLMLGINYWCVFPTKNIRIEGFSLTREQAEFWNVMYLNGLGEFFYDMQMDFRNLIAFPYDPMGVTPESGKLKHSRRNEKRALLLNGAGKDSILSAEILKASGIPFDFFVCAPTPAHRRVAALVGAHTLSVTRRYDPLLKVVKVIFGISNAYPSVSTFTFIAILLAELCGYDSVVFSNEEALTITPEDVRNNLCIIVASLDAFRKDASIQKKYKVYKENGSLMDHFNNLKDESLLEKDEAGTVINSLANVIRKNTPLIVIDEGHHTQTDLSVRFLAELKPSFIIEFTATPRDGSNILINTSAAELKLEEMVKIPIVLESRSQWEQVVADGLMKREELEKRAKKLKGEKIRPIALLQAQPKSKVRSTVTVEQLKQMLLDRKIPENQIKIKTSEVDELEGIDLFDNKCEVRYILTVNALAEGWDCSYAYVLISVANLGAKVAVEQIIGRVIRMPNAKRKSDEALNRSYVFASAANFNEAASKVIGGLEDNGYSRADFVGASEQEEYSDPLEAKKAIKKNLAVPMMALDKEKLSFEDLLGEDFELSKQEADFDFKIHYDLDGQATIDITEDDEWLQGKQLSLPYQYLDGDHSADELAVWLDKKLRFPMVNPEDKITFIEKAIQGQIKKHKRTLPELSVNRYLLADRLGVVITEALEAYTKKRFAKLLSEKKLSAEAFDVYPSTIALKSPVPKVFNKNLYERIDGINGEERGFVERIDLGVLDNIDFWVRNREKVDPFYIQGWRKGKFYPDFVAVTKKGNIVALEWKGEDRISNEDTAYKVEIAKDWEKLGKGKIYFFLVHNGNSEEVLTELKGL